MVQQGVRRASECGVEEDAAADDEVTFDDIMGAVGDAGTYQKRFNFLFNFLCCMVVSMTYLNNIIALSVPEHWCHVPGREAANVSLDAWKQIHLPVETDSRGQESLSKCFMYNRTSNESQMMASPAGNTTAESGVIGCQYGWEYSDTWYIETAPSSQDWVCDRELYATNSLVLGRAGDVIGTFIFGQLGDTLGRRPVYYITLVTLGVGRLLMTFTASNYLLFGAASVIGSLTCTAVFQAPVVITMEISRNEDRARIAMTQSLAWTAANCTMPMIMWAVGHWVVFMLITTLPAFLFLLTFRFMVESPRWLLTRGRPEECLKQLQHIARVNKTRVPEHALKSLKKISSDSSAHGMMGLISSARLIRNTFLLIFVWVACSLCYYTLIFNIGNMDGNPFLNFLYQSVAELPGYVIGQFMCERFGRRFTQLFAFLTTFFTAILIAAIINNTELAWLAVPLAALVKFFISFGFYVINLQTIEIYPTCIRQSGTAVCIIFASACGVIAPYIVYIGVTYNARYPYIITSIVVLSAAIIGSFLPETLHHKLPETLEDAQDFGQEQNYWRLIPKKQSGEKSYKECNDRIDHP